MVTNKNEYSNKFYLNIYLLLKKMTKNKFEVVSVAKDYQREEVFPIGIIIFF